MTTGRINQVASSYDAAAAGALSRGTGARAGGRAGLCFYRSRSVGGAIARPSRVLSVPHPRVRPTPSAEGEGGSLRLASDEDAGLRVRPAAREGAGRSFPNLADWGSVLSIRACNTGNRTRPQGFAPLGPWNDGAHVPPVRCASKEPGRPHTPDATHARSQAPYPAPTARPTADPRVIRRQPRGSGWSNA